MEEMGSKWQTAGIIKSGLDVGISRAIGHDLLTFSSVNYGGDQDVIDEMASRQVGHTNDAWSGTYCRSFKIEGGYAFGSTSMQHKRHSRATISPLTNCS